MNDKKENTIGLKFFTTSRFILNAPPIIREQELQDKLQKKTAGMCWLYKIEQTKQHSTISFDYEKGKTIFEIELIDSIFQQLNTTQKLLFRKKIIQNEALWSYSNRSDQNINVMIPDSTSDIDQIMGRTLSPLEVLQSKPCILNAFDLANKIYDRKIVFYTGHQNI